MINNTFGINLWFDNVFLSGTRCFAKKEQVENDERLEWLLANKNDDYSVKVKTF